VCRSLEVTYTSRSAATSHRPAMVLSRPSAAEAPDRVHESGRHHVAVHAPRLPPHLQQPDAEVVHEGVVLPAMTGHASEALTDRYSYVATDEKRRPGRPG
jgi:hypothetical protein